ncbi:MAG: LysR family transcriptional regulator [bacterium]
MYFHFSTTEPYKKCGLQVIREVSVFDDRTISALLSLAQTRNFKETAQALELSQPTLTRIVQKAEKDVGSQVFNRSGGTITLTRFGLELLEVCREQKLWNEKIVDRIETLKSGIDRVSIVCGPLTTIPIVAPAIEKCGDISDKVTIDISISASLDCRVLASDPCVDIFIGDLTHTTTTVELEIVRVPRKPLVIVAAPEHPIAQIDSLAFAEVFRYPIASPFLHQYWKAEFGKILEAYGIDPSWRKIPAIETDDYLLIHKLVQSGNFLSGAPIELFADAIKAGELVKLTVNDAPSWNICLARKADTDRSAVSILWDSLKEMAL